MRLKVRQRFLQYLLLDGYPIIFKAGPHRVRKNSRRRAKDLFQALADVLRYLSAFRFAHQIDFGKQDGYLRRVLVNATQQINVLLRERRIDADRDQRQSYVWQPTKRRFGVVGQRAFQSRHVDEAQGAHPRQLRQLDLKRRDSLRVFGILAFSDEAWDISDRDLLNSAIEEVNCYVFTTPVANLSHNRSDWDNSDRQQIAVKEMVKKAALTRFESADNRHAQHVVSLQLFDTVQERLKRGKLVSLGQI